MATPHLLLRHNEGPGADGSLYLPIGQGKAAHLSDWDGPYGVKALIDANEARILDFSEIVDLGDHAAA